MKKAVVLVSGGLDSATVLAIAQSAGYDCYAVSFDYGQRHSAELNAARRVASEAGVTEHRIVAIDLSQFGGSALTDETIDVPAANQEQVGSEIPITYVPARNTIFLSYALAVAEVNQSKDIFIGVNALDYSGYPDCRPEYIETFEKLGNLATRAGVEEGGLSVHTPLIHLTKAEIIQEGIKLGVDYGMTISCYDPDATGRACGHCDSCQLRKKGFQDAGVDDPTRYQDYV